MKVTAVVDTNVLVAGILSANEHSPVCQVLDGMLAGRFPFLLSHDLLDEYRRVLLRQKIQDLHGLTPEQIDLLLTQIVANAMIREPRPAPAAPDPGDDHLWQLLRTDAGPVLVTGDQRLLERPPDFASVVSPRAFLDLLGP